MDASDFERMTWSDVELESIAWQSEGRDMVFHLRSVGEDTGTCIKRIMTCRWTEALEIRLAFPQGHGGYALTWDGAIRRLHDGTYSVHFDFAKNGEIRLLCAEIEVIAA